MKLLLFYTHQFWYRPFEKTLAGAEEATGEEEVRETVSVFFHVEAHDEGRETELALKFAKNVKWLAGKFGTKSVLLHSFNHLSESKASPEIAQNIATDTRNRLKRAGYLVRTTPFGYLNEWRMHVGGESLAKVFKDL